MPARTIMIQGTASNVGKSLLVTALCRILRQDGWAVAPFKSQNMSNNSYVTADGREIGRAQGVQAQAAGVPASPDMNPVLLKPSGDSRSQVIIHGRPHASMDFRDYRGQGFDLAANAINDSLFRLREEYEVVVIEGAGSPAEVNLKDRELVNMRIAEWAEAPVLLVADIDRGGALASLVGTLALLEPDECERVAGLVINKFRGDRDLLRPAEDFLEQRTGKPILGVLPYLDVELEAEDSQSLPARRGGGTGAGAGAGADDGVGGLRIAALRLPRLSNFTDLDPLAQAPATTVLWVTSPAELADVDAVVIPGSKNTAEDLRWVWRTGLGAAVGRLAARGVPVAGICGGYQMLGNRVLDPGAHESAHAQTPGLELLDLETAFAPLAAKVTERTVAEVTADQGPFAGLAGMTVGGYEIHKGQTSLGAAARPLLLGEAGPAGPKVLGASDQAGQVWGTYLHDIFHNDGLRRAWLNWLRRRRGLPPVAAADGDAPGREETFDRLAAAVRAALDMGRVYDILGIARR